MHSSWPVTTDAPELAEGEAHAWAVPLVVDDAAYEKCWGALSVDERKRADGFRFQNVRRAFIVAHGGLRSVLGQYLGQQARDVTYSFQRGSKPRIGSEYESSQLHFNLSHSGNLAVVLVTKGCEVGVYVERLREVNQLENIALRYFHPTEVEAVLATAEDGRSEAFLRCWTAKEAALKAYGTGIVESLDAFDVPLEQSFADWIDLSALRNAEQGSRCWLERIAPCDGYVAAAAFMGEQRRLRCFQFAM